MRSMNRIPVLLTKRTFLDIAVVVLAVFFDIRLVYILFFIKTGLILKDGLNTKSLLRWCLWSVILPDNYTVIILLLILYIYMTIKGKTQFKPYHLAGICILLYGISNSVIRGIPVQSLFITLLFFSSIIILWLLYTNAGIVNNVKYLRDDLIAIALIEISTTPLNLIKNYLFESRRDAWSTGTFGDAQQAQFFLVMAFLSVFFFADAEKKKSRKIGVCCAVSALSTFCWAQSITAVFMITLFALLGWLNRGRMRVRRFVVICSFVLCITGVLFITKSQSSIASQLRRMTVNYTPEYVNSRIPKIRLYYDTYITISKKDPGYLLFGNGIGRYASRGALASTGYYIDAYNRLFQKYASDYTEEYIVPGLILAKQYSHQNPGSVLSRPYSSFIALMGECGLMGVIIILAYLHSFYVTGNKYQRTLFAVMISSCILENYLEYARIVLVFFVVYLLIRSNGIENKQY